MPTALILPQSLQLSLRSTNAAYVRQWLPILHTPGLRCRAIVRSFGHNKSRFNGSSVPNIQFYLSGAMNLKVIRYAPAEHPAESDTHFHRALPAKVTRYARAKRTDEPDIRFRRTFPDENIIKYTLSERSLKADVPVCETLTAKDVIKLALSEHKNREPTDQQEKRRKFDAVAHAISPDCDVVSAVVNSEEQRQEKIKEMQRLGSEKPKTLENGHYAVAQECLEELLVVNGVKPAAYMYNALVRVNLDSWYGSSEEVAMLLEDMLQEGLVPDTWLWHDILKVLTSANDSASSDAKKFSGSVCASELLTARPRSGKNSRKLVLTFG